MGPLKNPAASNQIHIFDSTESLIEGAANFLTGLVKNQAQFSLSLSGGSTPEGLYRRMAQTDMRANWSQVDFFFGDERWVPADDPRSNYRMVKNALFSPAGIPGQQIHSVPTTLSSPEESAEQYGKKIADFFKIKSGDFPVFDLILLGLGEDGHTASLFPGDKSLSEKKKLVTAGKLTSQEPRITLTYPVINNAKKAAFLVSGEKKAEMVKNILHPDASTPDFPARGVNLADGELHWFLDKAAARLI